MVFAETISGARSISASELLTRRYKLVVSVTFMIPYPTIGTALFVPAKVSVA